MARRVNSNSSVITIGALIVLAIILIPFISSGVVVSGYDGIVSEVVGVQYTPREGIDGTTVDYGGTYISIDEQYGTGHEVFGPTGLRASVSGGVGIDESEVIYEASEPLANGGYKLWKVSEVKCTMGLSIVTIPQGNSPVTDVRFTFQLTENQFSVFSTADQQYAFIIGVSTQSVPQVQGGQMVTSVMESGHNFALNPVAVHEPPAWVEESGFTDILSNFAIVQFDVTVIQATPSFPFLAPRIEAEIGYDIEVDVIVFGFWEVVQDVNDYDIQPDPNPFAWLGEFFGSLGDGAVGLVQGAGIVILVIVVGAFVMIYFIIKARSSGGSRRRR